MLKFINRIFRDSLHVDWRSQVKPISSHTPTRRAVITGLILMWLALAVFLFFSTQPFYGPSPTGAFYSSGSASAARDLLMPWLSANYQQ
jgi:hypothetical protein